MQLIRDDVICIFFKITFNVKSFFLMRLSFQISCFSSPTLFAVSIGSLLTHSSNMPHMYT